MSPSWPGTLSPLAGVAAAFAPGPRGVVAGVEKARRFAPPVAGVRAKGSSARPRPARRAAARRRRRSGRPRARAERRAARGPGSSGSRGSPVGGVRGRWCHPGRGRRDRHLRDVDARAEKGGLGVSARDARAARDATARRLEGRPRRRTSDPGGLDARRAGPTPAGERAERCVVGRGRGERVSPPVPTQLSKSSSAPFHEVMVYHILADESPFVESRRSVSRR